MASLSFELWVVNEKVTFPDPYFDEPVRAFEQSYYGWRQISTAYGFCWWEDDPDEFTVTAGFHYWRPRNEKEDWFPSWVDHYLAALDRVEIPDEDWV